MLAKQRQAVILEEVRRRGGVRVSDLTELLEVSDMTIRRDLDVLARPGNAVGLTAGTTTWTLARRLTELPGLTVVTNSIQVAEVFYQSDGVEQTVVLTGGLHTPSDALVGPVAVASIRALNLDLLFMGVHGMDARAGFSTPNLMEAETDRVMARAARRVVVVADHTKWGTIGLSSILALDEADVLVTDELLDEDARRVLAENVGELLIAPLGARAAAER